MDESVLAPAPRLEPVVIEERDAVPVTLLTGFLGAGKTTLLNRILNGDHGLRVGVLVNDFGAINIDAELVEGVEENTISLTNGCVCCEIRDDLVLSIEEMLERGDEIDYIILEASGVADPEGVVMTFLNPRYEGLLRLDSISCIVDAEAIFTHGDNEHLNMLKLRQIGFADLVILNKVDLVSREQVEVIREWVGQSLSRVRIVEAVDCEVPLEILLAVGRFDPQSALERAEADGDDAAAGHGRVSAHGVYETWSYESDEPFDMSALRTMVRRELPASVLRCKGFAYVADEPNQRALIQAVGRRVVVGYGGAWDSDPRTRLVAIGTVGDLDPDELTERFDACLARSSVE